MEITRDSSIRLSNSAVSIIIGGDSTPIARPDPDEIEGQRGQIRQLVKHALETPTPQGLTDFLRFGIKFRRLSIWNARMAYIQRPGARLIASEYEWKTVGRRVLPDAVPIIILWPFSPIRFVYELADTSPAIDRHSIQDPFAATGELSTKTLTKLTLNLKKQKTFKIDVELRRQGFNYAGSAAAQIPIPFMGTTAPPDNYKSIGEFAHENASAAEPSNAGRLPIFRITVNDRLTPVERFVTIAHELGHIFCGHQGGCFALGGRENEESGWPDRRGLGKHAKEIEAEAVAYLVASRASVTTRSAEYLKVHAQKADITKIDLDLIVRAAARVERLAYIHYGKMQFKQ